MNTILEMVAAIWSVLTVVAVIETCIQFIERIVKRFKH